MRFEGRLVMACAAGVEETVAMADARFCCPDEGVVSAEDIVIGLVDVVASGVGFFFPNPGVEKDECDGVFCTVVSHMGTLHTVQRKENANLELSWLRAVLKLRAWSPL